MFEFTIQLIARHKRFMELVLPNHNIMEKSAYCFYDEYLRVYDKHFPCSGGFLGEMLYSSLGGVVFPQYNFLYELADETIQLLLSNGILKHSLHMTHYEVEVKMYQISLKHKFINNEKSRVLKIDDLSYGFILWMFAIIISSIVFLTELSTFYLKMNPFVIVIDFVGMILVSRFSIRHF